MKEKARCYFEEIEENTDGPMIRFIIGKRKVFDISGNEAVIPPACC